MNSVLVDDKGPEHVRQQKKVEVDVKYVVLSELTPSAQNMADNSRAAQLTVVRAAAYDAVNTTYVVPANEQRRVWEEINQKKRKRVVPADLDGDGGFDPNADNTSHGAVGTSNRFIGAREHRDNKRTRQAQDRAAGAAAKVEKKQKLERDALLKGAKLEQQLVGTGAVPGIELTSLKVAELKTLILARGGVPKGLKADLLAQLTATENDDETLLLPPMSVGQMAAVAALAVAVVEQVEDEVEEEEENTMASVATEIEEGMTVEAQDSSGEEEEEEEEEESYGASLMRGVIRGKSDARKVELIAAAEALSSQSVAMDDEEDEVDTLEDSLTLMDDQRQPSQSQPQQQQQQQQQPQQQRQQQQQQPQKAKSAPRKRPAKRQRKRPAPQQQQQPDGAGNESCTLDEEALLASWRELVSTSAKSIGRSANNIARYLTEAKFQVEVLSVVGVAEIMQLVGAVGGIDSAGRARVHTLLVAGLANPLLKTPTKLKIQHTLSRAALSSVLQAVAIK
jgi:outer membrane biosynthesis protein TonB